jgi:hypothetical protein
MGNDTLWWYGFGLCVVLGLSMLIPFWRGKRDALTAWNLLLLGSIVQIGVGFMEVYAHKMHWSELRWFTESTHEVRWLLYGTTVFYGSLLFFHHFVRFPSRLLENRLAKWPELSPGMVVFVLTLCLGVTAVFPLLEGVPFFREVAFNFSHSVLAIAATFATVYWLKNRLSPFALLLMVVTLVTALVESMVSFAGRRLLLTVAFGPIAACYWISWRYWSRTKVVLGLGSLAVFMVVISAGYATFRHMTTERSASSVVDKATSVSVADVQEQLADLYHYLAQYTVHYSMLTMRMVDDGRMEEVPLDSLWLVASYPIPRSMWPDKPRDECLYLSTDILHMPYKTNWGVGITGQGYHDGGTMALIVYAFLLSCLVRVIDVPLSLQPDNPFLIGLLAASSAHIAAIPRGSLANMTTNVLECIALVLALAFVCRVLFGTARRYPAVPYAWGAPARYPQQ